MLVLVACVSGGAVYAADQAPTPDRSDSIILVIGATGQQGGAVARELLARGYQVRGLTRNPAGERAQAMADLGAVMVRGDLDDRASLEDAMDGVDGVFAVTDFWEHGYEGEVRHGRNVVDAAQAAGVGHLVYTSVASADRNTGIPHFDSKNEIDEYIRNSGIGFTIIKPVSFMQNWSRARDSVAANGLRTPQGPDTKTLLISTADIGRFAAEAFDDPDRWKGVEKDIAGDAYTMTELAGLFSKVLDRPVPYQRLSWDDYEKNSGEEMTVMVRWFDEVGYDVDVDELRREFPWLVRFDDYLETAWAE